MDNAKLTQRQVEALAPLEAEANSNRKQRERLRKRLAFEQAIGFEDNKAVREQVAELDAEYKDLSVKIAEIYAAESEMMKHMRTVLAEVEEVRKIADRWGFEIDI